MTVALSILQPSLRIQLPGILEPVLADTILRVTRQFFWRSEAWKYTYDNGLDWTLTQLALEAPVAGTDIPTKCIVKRVDQIKYDSGGDAWDDEVQFKTRDQLDRENPNWNTEVGTSPTAWTHGNDGAALVIPQVAATVTTAFLIRAIVAPVFTDVTDTLPDFLFYEHEEALKYGVLAELMKQPGKDWSDSALAAFYLTQYEASIRSAKSRAEADFGQPKDTMAYGGL